MAFLERIRFSFFDLKENVDGGKIAEALGHARVSSCSNGYGFLVLGDSSGRIHLVNKAFEVKTFQAYNQCVTLVEQCNQSPYLATIGEDGIGINPHLRIWHTEKLDKNDIPLCLRVTRVSIPNKVVIPTAMCIADNLTTMAIGFNDGSILIYRGDIKKDRSSKQTLLKDELSSVTGLSISGFGKNVSLFVATVNSIEMYDISNKDKEKRVTLDSESGCPLRCSVLVEEEKEKHFFVARNKAIYCYTNGVLGPCYAVDGEKLQLRWFRGYLIIISEETHPSFILGSLSPPKRNENYQKGSHVITILDIQNNVTAFHSNVNDVQEVFIEWGSLFILSPERKLSHVQEKDLHSKLALLLKKNLYDVAIKVANFQKYDSDGLMEIYRQYGDHLNSRGDHKGAIEQYIKTIGKFKPSYVIRKYLGSQQVENLTTYLQALHLKGVASGEHTTLLLNFYTKLNKPELLKEFIMAKDREIDFDVKVAIDVCRHVSPEDALLLAEKHGQHDLYLSIQIEDLCNYKAGLDYISKLPFHNADELIHKYGSLLLDNIPDETTKFLILLCSDYKPSNQFLVDDDYMNGSNYRIPLKANASDFIHYFLHDSVRLVEFLEKLAESGSVGNVQVHSTLLENYLSLWKSCDDISSKSSYESKIMKLLEMSDESCNKHQSMILCKMSNFKKGLLYLYEQCKMYQSVLKYYVQENDLTSLLGCCRRFEHQEPGLWVQALIELKSREDLEEEVLNEILNAIDRGNLMAPLLVIDTLSQSPHFQTGILKPYLKKVLLNEHNLKEEQTKRLMAYKNEILEIQNGIEHMIRKPIKFQASRCAICKNQLELPAVHFFCQHSFHQHCIQSYADNEDECPPCKETNKQLIEAIKSQEENKDLHEMFHSQLEHAEDGFSLVTDYLGRGVFTKLTSYGEVAMRAEVLKAKIDPKSTTSSNLTYSRQPHATGRMNEEALSPLYDAPRYGTSSKVAIEKQSPLSYGQFAKSSYNSPKTVVEPSSTNVKKPPVNAPSNNPFGDFEDCNDDDGPSNNPFADDSLNPFGNHGDDEFGESDDYDKNLNPFA